MLGTSLTYSEEQTADYKSDLNILEDQAKWLNHNLINTGQFLQKQKSPNMQCLYTYSMMPHCLQLSLSNPNKDPLCKFLTVLRHTGCVFWPLEASNSRMESLFTSGRKVRLIVGPKATKAIQYSIIFEPSGSTFIFFQCMHVCARCFI